jgi:NAD(P)-dependent dehydrogenase (short-subunit alcohol dehydrogenase family)
VTDPAAAAERPAAGRSVLVTGGTAGIGFHTAAALAAQGARVIVTGRDHQRGVEAVRLLRARGGHDRVEFRAVDHTTVGANQQLGCDLRESLDRLDVLVNNVGRVFSTRVETEDGYEATLALCFVGPAALTAELRPLIAKSAPARIVNVVSSAYKMWQNPPLEDVQSEERFVGIQAHAHAKQLNLIWTFALARQLDASGVTANATNPGAAWTPGTAALTKEAVPAWRYVWPIVRFLQRRTSAEKAARTPVWLASAAEASELTGTYAEEDKREQPELAVDPENQQRVTELAQRLIDEAPTATDGDR